MPAEPSPWQALLLSRWPGSSPSNPELSWPGSDWSQRGRRMPVRAGSGSDHCLLLVKIALTALNGDCENELRTGGAAST